MNEDESAARYKSYISGVFTRASASYDQVGPQPFAYFGERLVDFASIPAGARVLDIASGRGAVLFPAARAASPSGEVTGIDISPAMVAQLQQEAALAELDNVQILTMDAEDLHFSSSTFDYALCGFALFFLPRLSDALAEIGRVLKPGGHFTTSTFEAYETETRARWQALRESIKDRLPPAPSAELNRLSSEEELRESLSQAGFSDIEIVRDHKTFYYRSKEEMWQSLWTHGGRGFLERMDAETLTYYKEQVLDTVLEETEQGVPDDWHIFYTRALKR